jgi:dienelactone hydrolase
MARLIKLLLAIMVLALLAAAGAIFAYRWQGAHPSFLKADARAAHARFMASGLKLVTPSGPGPFRTVLLIPGCGGIRRGDGPNPIMDEYAQSAVEAGWAAAILDSYGPRHWDPAWARSRVCAGVRLQGLNRAADVLAGLDLLRVDTRVDQRHLRIASWSHGGWAVGDLLTLREPDHGSFKRTMATVEAIQFTYPYCARPSRGGRWDWTWRGWVRIVFAENDVVQKPQGCMPMVERARKAGSIVDIVTIPGVTHAFDERVQTPQSRFKFDPAATARSHADFITWLKTRPPQRRPPQVVTPKRPRGHPGAG